MKKLMACLLLCMMLRGCVVDAGTAQTAPFAVKNQSPLVAVYGLPAVEPGGIRKIGQGMLCLSVDWANHFVTGHSGDENLLLDGESLRIAVAGRYGWGRHFEVGFEIPLLMSGGGWLDGFIENYHSTFGFPNGGREYAPKNRLSYSYEKNGITLLHMESSGQGPGDIRLTGAWRLAAGADGLWNLALRGSLKLPTGDVGSLRGSGSTDLALWISGDWSEPFSLRPLSGFVAAGVLGMTKGRVLPDQQRPLVGFGALGLSLRVAPVLALKAQINAHTSFYTDSDLSEISGASAQVTVGGAFDLTPKMTVDIGITEDMIVGTAPDVVFHLSLYRAF